MDSRERSDDDDAAAEGAARNAVCPVSRAFFKGSEDMSVKAGEKAQKSGDLHCEKCHHEVHVTVGRKIPRCPHCGNESYSSRTHETGNKSS